MTILVYFVLVGVGLVVMALVSLALAGASGLLVPALVSHVLVAPAGLLVMALMPLVLDGLRTC